ncbi:hypothetical protein GEU84_014640 [Fertoebacter nigrum]|uniref:Uncharacterized protein n=1 Tax=Fertoeibacter niger TaxID=2656921 RepID=A0A8X8GWJ6_9RHOB|nr:hypothetical protein [Fertoeibacter niger]NUB45633.1 hypothetical protein [Fertoeibacter niger]
MTRLAPVLRAHGSHMNMEILHVGDAGFEFPPDQIRKGAHVFSRRRQERPVGGMQASGRTLGCEQSDQQHMRSRA